MKVRMLGCLAAMALLVGPAVAAEPEEGGRSPSAEGATVGFANLADGDVVPSVFTARFNIAGMGIAPAGVPIDFTGHFHLLIDPAELPPMDQPLPSDKHQLDFGQGQTKAELRLTEGQHSLQLILADHEHLPHEPPVISDRITVTVAAGAAPPEDLSERSFESENRRTESRQLSLHADR